MNKVATQVHFDPSGVEVESYPPVGEERKFAVIRLGDAALFVDRSNIEQLLSATSEAYNHLKDEERAA